jgi:hypothetical protein
VWVGVALAEAVRVAAEMAVAAREGAGLVAVAEVVAETEAAVWVKEEVAPVEAAEVEVGMVGAALAEEAEEAA